MDCNKTIDFFVEAKRLCDSRVSCLGGDKTCPLYDFCDRAITMIDDEDVETVVEILQKRSDEHPRKTYAQDFFEKLPKAKPDKEGVPWMCRANCYGGSCQYSAVSGASPAPCKACWNEEMEAADDE